MPADAFYDEMKRLGANQVKLADVSPESKRRIIQALINKVVVTKDGFDLHFFAGVDQIKKGEVLASPAVSLN